MKASRYAIWMDCRRVYMPWYELHNHLSFGGWEREAAAVQAAYAVRDYGRIRRILAKVGGRFATLDVFPPLNPIYHQTAPHGKHYRITLPWPRQVVEKDELDRYAWRVHGRLGRAASGWGTCARQLGDQSHLDGWQDGTDHPGLGSVVIQQSPPRIILQNHVPYAQRLIERPVRQNLIDKAARAIVEELTSGDR